ncbi:MAG: DNA polymerase III, subunit gamma and tau, partial [Candidatus Levybacteria bacterium CG_4_10_14_0_2_um_filter_35_8]
IAKVINCEKLVASHWSLVVDKKGLKTKDQLPETNPEPCNKCEQCLSITNGTNIDILEIDGASNRGIDEIRDLREKIKFSPAYANKKVYIIDEVHMLTTEAFNALLKTLEEPPAHAIFILCTTEPHKIPATISSRCFHISFKMATNEELARSFARIAKSEKITIDKDALDLIANISDGSFRDGVKALEEIMTLAKGEKITKELIERKYKISTVDRQALKLLEYLALKDAKKSLTLVSKLVEQGIDIKYFVEEVASKIHLMLLKEAGVEQNEKELSQENFTLEEIFRIAGLLEKAAYQLKFSVLPQLP